METNKNIIEKQKKSVCVCVCVCVYVCLLVCVSIVVYNL